MAFFWTDSGLTGFVEVNGQRSAPVLVLMTDERLQDPLAAVKRLPRKSWVIFRTRQNFEPTLGTKDLRRLCRERDLSFLVAGDHVLAESLQADGIHLPEFMARHACLAPYLAWRRQARGRLLTVAAHSRRALARANELGADAALLSPVFATASHPEARLLGLLRLQNLALESQVPIIALGGISRTNARQLAFARLRGIAGISAFTS